MFSNPFPDLEPNLPNMTMPVLILVGEKDAINPYDVLRQMCEQLPDSTFIMLPDVGHEQSWSRSDLVLPHIKQFLTRVSKT